jgi:hypothetical protein
MGGGHYFWLGASADADPATHEPSLATRLGPTGECPLRCVICGQSDGEHSWTEHRLSEIEDEEWRDS